MAEHVSGDLLCDYAEGQLEPMARQGVESHLHSCADCRRELAMVRGYFQELSGLEPHKAPADFLARVRARLPAASPSPWKAIAWLWSPGRIPLALRFASLSVLAVISLAFYLMQGGTPSDETRIATLASPEKQPSPAAAPEQAAPVAKLDAEEPAVDPYADAQPETDAKAAAAAPPAPASPLPPRVAMRAKKAVPAGQTGGMGQLALSNQASMRAARSVRQERADESRGSGIAEGKNGGETTPTQDGWADAVQSDQAEKVAPASDALALKKTESQPKAKPAPARIAAAPVAADQAVPSAAYILENSASAATPPAASQTGALGAKMAMPVKEKMEAPVLISVTLAMSEPHADEKKETTRSNSRDKDASLDREFAGTLAALIREVEKLGGQIQEIGSLKKSPEMAKPAAGRKFQIEMPEAGLGELESLLRRYGKVEGLPKRQSPKGSGKARISLQVISL